MYLQWPLLPLLYLDIQYTAGNSKLGHKIIIFLALIGLKTKGIYASIFKKQGRNRPLDTPKRMIERRERERKVKFEI